MIEVLEVAQLLEQVREMNRLARRTLGLLGVTGGARSPVKYQAVISACTQLSEMWSRHLRFKGEAMPGDEDADTEILRQLQAIASADWPRSPQIGWNSIRIRARETLGLLLRQLETERLALLPVTGPQLRPALAGSTKKHEETGSVSPERVSA